MGICILLKNLDIVDEASMYSSSLVVCGTLRLLDTKESLSDKWYFWGSLQKWGSGSAGYSNTIWNWGVAGKAWAGHGGKCKKCGSEVTAEITAPIHCLCMAQFLHGDKKNPKALPVIYCCPVICWGKAGSVHMESYWVSCVPRTR